MTECAHAGGISSEFAGTDKGIVRRCVDCGEVVRRQDAESAPAQAVAPAVVVAPAASVPTPAALERKRPPKPIDVVRLAKSRLKDIKRELRKLRKLEREQAQLERLLNAADGKPAAVVRELKASSR